jgi:uncharacterized protein (TIGR03437 family)
VKATFRAGLFIVLSAAAALCDPVTWTLYNATFNDGGTATGYFVFDADTDTFSNWNIVASAGSTLPAFTYTPATSTVKYVPNGDISCAGPCIEFASNQQFPNGGAPPYNNATRYLDLSFFNGQPFVAPLTDGGGTVKLYLSNLYNNSSHECLNCVPFRLFTQGSVVAVPQQLPQTITFGPLNNQVLGTAPFALSATASSGLTVTFASNTPSVCTVSGVTVTLVAVGTCSITASQAGNSNYAAAAPVTLSFTVKAAMSASPLTWTLNATFDDGGTAVGVFTFDSDTRSFSNWDVSTTGGNTSVFFPFDFTPENSSLGFNNPLDDPSQREIVFASSASFPDPLAPNPESLVLVITPASSLSDAGGTVDISPGVTLVFSGECFDCNPARLITSGTVYAAQGNQASQTITFGPLSNQVLGTAPFALTATASSGLAVTFASNTPSVCTVSGVTVTMVAVGTCSIAASQAGNANYAAAAPVTQSFTVNAANSANLAVTPATLSFQAWQGAPVQSQSLQIGGTAGTAWQATAATFTGGAWLSVSPGAGQIPAGLAVLVNSGGLAPGTYQGSITVQAPAAAPSSSTISVMLTVTAASGQGGIISTIAGNGAQGFSGDGGPATSASLYDPDAVAMDVSGNLFIAEYGNNRIRKASASGIITTVAGNGSYGFSGDGGLATSAALGGPGGVAVDGSGNLFIADEGNNRIRKASASGIITTVAGTGPSCEEFEPPLCGGYSGDGGPATSAGLDGPIGVAVDGSGNLFIADFGNSRIRKVSASGIITTVAGNGNPSFSGDGGPAASASLSFPEGVTVDAAGNLFIADGGNNRIRKVSANGMITTVAGNGTLGFSGDGGAATSAELDNPGDVTVDASGNVFIVDNQRIRKVSSSGVITTVAGNGIAGFSGDGGLATSATLEYPSKIAVDSSGNLLIADNGNNRIRKVSASATMAPPTINSGGIVPVDSTVATIQPGEWVSIYGANLASSTVSWVGTFPTSLGGTSVAINGRGAYLSFVSPTQINLQAPDDTATGSVPLVVTTAAGTATSTVTLAPFAPSFFLFDAKHVAGIIRRSDGSGAYGGGTYDIIGPTGTSLGYATVAAKAGDILELFGTGFGATSPAVQAGQTFAGAAATTNTVNLLIDNVSVIPMWAGLSSAGLDQINVTVPAGLGIGDVSLVATVGGVQTPSGVVISIQ